jgi:CheY-like chemotaxis protein
MDAQGSRAATEHVPRILIVEDDDELRAVLGYFFREEGFDVALATNGVEAIEWFESNSACAVVLDLLMPGIIGQELLEHMRSEDKLAAIPVAIVSGSPELAPEGYRVFSKPVDLPALREFARTVCGHRAA